MADKQVEEEKVVIFHYTLTDDEGEVIDSSDENTPLPYLHGAGNIVPGLEKEMVGKGVGDSFKATVPPTEGYGERQGPPPQPVERTAFPPNVDIEEGMPFMAEGPDGSQMTLWVTGVDDEQVFVDTNHPLAGETLHFDVEIVDIRDATDEELDHGHPHGPDGNAQH